MLDSFFGQKGEKLFSKSRPAKQTKAWSRIPEIRARESKQLLTKIVCLKARRPKTADQGSRARSGNACRREPMCSQLDKHAGMGKEAEKARRHRQSEGFFGEPLA